MKEKINLQVGQKLWWVPSVYEGKEREVTIISVGRKWVKLENNRNRIDKNTLHADGGRYMSPGQCYLSKEHYNDIMRTQQAWRDLRGKMLYGKPPHITIDKIETMLKILEDMP